MRNYSTQIKNELKDKIDLVSGRKEGAPDYFAYIRGSGITEDTQESGYRGAVAAALRASNEYDTTFQTDADLCIRTIEDVYTAAQEADANCCAKLRAVIESLQEWKLLARKLNLSITGGGGYQEQLFTANNIRCWVGNVPQTVAQVSVDCWKDIFTDIDPTTGEATYNQAALTDYFALSEEVYTQDSPNSVFAIMTAGLVEATDLVCLTSDRNFNAEQFNLLMQCGTTQIFSLPPILNSLDTGDYCMNYEVSSLLQNFATLYDGIISAKLSNGVCICNAAANSPDTFSVYANNITQQAQFSDLMNYLTQGNCISISVRLTSEQIDEAALAVSRGIASQSILANLAVDVEGNYLLDPFTNAGRYVPTDLSIAYKDIAETYGNSVPTGVRINGPITISQVDFSNCDGEGEPLITILSEERGYIDCYSLSSVANGTELNELLNSRIEKLRINTENIVQDTFSSEFFAGMVEYVATDIIGETLPEGGSILLNASVIAADSLNSAIQKYNDALVNNSNIDTINSIRGISAAIEATGASVSLFINNEGTATIVREQVTEGILQEHLCYLSYCNDLYGLHTNDELIEQMNSRDDLLSSTDLVILQKEIDSEGDPNYTKLYEYWPDILFANVGIDSEDCSFDTFDTYLQKAWEDYCVNFGEAEYQSLFVNQLSADDLMKVYLYYISDYKEPTLIDLSKYAQYLKYYN